MSYTQEQIDRANQVDLKETSTDGNGMTVLPFRETNGSAIARAKEATLLNL